MSTARASHAIEIAVAALHQTAVRILAVRTGEAIEGGDRPVGRHFKDGAFVVRAAGVGCAVEVAVGALNEADEIRGQAVAPLKLCNEVKVWAFTPIAIAPQMQKTRQSPLRKLSLSILSPLR